jgi:predicted esterase
LRNWQRKSAVACATISLLACASARAQTDLPVPAAAAGAKSPAIAVLDAGEAQQWQGWAAEVGWKIISPAPLPATSAIDARVQAVQQAVQQAIRAGTVDPAHIYIAGRGDSAAAVFYTISRIPDLWAAGIALGGNPMVAVNTDRIFAGNFANAPVLWVSSGAGDQVVADKLKASGIRMEWRTATGLTNAAVFEWLLKHRRDEFPDSIDCETNSPTFGSCYWVQMTKFDPSERNDVLPSTHVTGGNGAALDLGGFSAKLDDPGPGLLIAKIPEKYNGPLKVNDRILELDGRPIENAHAYLDMMAKVTQEKRVTVMLQRGKDRMRLETRIVLPVKDPVVTARLQGKYDPETKGIDLISRTITEMKVTIPEHWLPAVLSWNGLTLENITKPGCLLLTMEKEILHAAVCQ